MDLLSDQKGESNWILIQNLEINFGGKFSYTQCIVKWPTAQKLWDVVSMICETLK